MNKIPVIMPEGRKTLAFIVILGLLVYIVFLILKRLGLVKSKTERDTKKEVEEYKASEKLGYSNISKMPYFDPRYYKTYTPKLHTLLPPSVALNKAVEINNAFGIFNDNEDALFGAFQNLEYKHQISQVAESFYNKYKKDLRNTLISKLSKSEVSRIVNIINSLK